MSKLVSIIINCYNGEKFLKKTLESIINQEYENWEVIVIDNHSNDNTDEVVHSFKNAKININVAIKIKKYITAFCNDI